MRLLFTLRAPSDGPELRRLAGELAQLAHESGLHQADPADPWTWCGTWQAAQECALSAPAWVRVTVTD